MKAQKLTNNVGFATLMIFCSFSIANSCSVCLCGDNLYLYGHGNQLQPGKFSISLENRYFSKSSGGTDVGSDVRENQREYRPTFTLARGFSNHLTVTANLATSFKRLQETESGVTNTEHVSGLGDLQVEAMWSKEVSQDLKRSYVLGIFLASKAPTGTNNKQVEGVRLDEHGQPGTGSWDFNTGLGLTRITESYSSFITAFYRMNGTNNYDYHFGNMYSFNIGGDYRPNPSYALSLAMNGRYAERDQEDSENLLNTGGWVLYLTPGFRYDFQSSLGIVANLQIPVYKDLYEEQDENAVFTLAFRYDIL